MIGARCGLLACVVLAIGCGRAPARRPVIAGSAPAGPAGLPPATAVEVLDLGEAFLSTRAAWHAANRPLAATDYDRTWNDLDGFLQEQYLAVVRQIVEVAQDVAAWDETLGPRAAEIARYLDGSADDPPGDIGHVADRLLDDCGRLIDRLAHAATPAEDSACLSARFALAQAIPDHRQAIEDARVTAEMDVHETGLPPGSAEQQEIEIEHAQLMTELDDWETGLAREAWDLAAAFELAPMPVVGPPAEIVPAPLTAEWAALWRAVMVARDACADGAP